MSANVKGGSGWKRLLADANAAQRVLSCKLGRISFPWLPSEFSSAGRGGLCLEAPAEKRKRLNKSFSSLSNPAGSAKEVKLRSGLLALARNSSAGDPARHLGDSDRELRS